MKTQTISSIFILLITILPYTMTSAKAVPVTVVISDFKLDSTSSSGSNGVSYYRVKADAKNVGNVNAQIAFQWFAFLPNTITTEPITSKQMVQLTPNGNLAAEASVADKYFNKDCVKLSLEAYDITTNLNQGTPGHVETICRQPAPPKALSGKWEWNNSGWVENQLLNTQKVKLGAFLKEDNGASWDYKTRTPQNVTLLEVQAKPHDAASANKPYTNNGSEMISALELEKNNAFFNVSFNKCYDFKVRVLTADGPTTDTKFTTKITPSPWRSFTAGSDCNTPNPIIKGKWEWFNGSLEGGVVPPVLHFFGKLSKDDGTLWDLKTAKPKYTSVEVHSRVHTATSFNQPYTQQYNVPVEPEAIVNGTHTFTLESGCKDYEVRLDTFDGVTANPNISNKITPSAWWHFMGGAACTLADTQKPAYALPPITPMPAIKPIDNVKSIIRPITPTVAPTPINPAVIVPKPISPAAVAAPNANNNEPIKPMITNRTIKKLNF